MNLIRQISSEIQEKYKDLASKLGDLEFRKSQLDKQIKDLKEEIKSLDDSFPTIQAIAKKIQDEQEKAVQETTSDDNNGN